jgi:hypothetical protein
MQTQTNYPIEQELHKVLKIILGRGPDDQQVQLKQGVVSINVDCDFGTINQGGQLIDVPSVIERAFTKSGFIKGKTFPHGEDWAPHLQFEIPDTLDAVAEMKRIQADLVFDKCVSALRPLRGVGDYIESSLAGDSNQIARVKENLLQEVAKNLGIAGLSKGRGGKV